MTAPSGCWVLALAFVPERQRGRRRGWVLRVRSLWKPPGTAAHPGPPLRRVPPAPSRSSEVSPRWLPAHSQWKPGLAGVNSVGFVSFRL